jgi:outer membrane scaffolding protein for murein synthesis (MipA/OmpV family)
MKFTTMTSTATMGMALLMLATGQAAAEEDMPATSSAGLHGSIGIGVGTMPEYEGAQDRKTRLTPNINLFYGDTFFLTGMKAGANLLRYQTEHGAAITAGPLLALRHGRDQDDNAALNGLGDIDRALDAGGFVRFRKQGWQASVDVRQNLSNTDQGATVNFTAGHGMRVSEKLRLRTSLDTTWASSDYMKTFFSIDATQSANSGIAQYDAGSGFKHVGASLMADYSINREWAGFATLRYKRLLGDAADSPIVTNLGARDQVSASVGIKYRF